MTWVEVEERRRARGLFRASLAIALFLAVFGAINIRDHEYEAAAVALTGLPLAAWSLYLSRRRPGPRWSAYPLIIYLAAMMVFMLAINLQHSTALMWLNAAPAIAMFCVGARVGLGVSGILFVAMVVTLVLNDHVLTQAYSLRMVCAYLLTASICFTYERNRERAVQELQTAARRIQSLEGLLPICAWCKKIRDDEGEWHRVEGYLADRAPVSFTHGICPQCDRKLEEEEMD